MRPPNLSRSAWAQIPLLSGAPWFFLREAGIVSSGRGHAVGWHITADLTIVTLPQLHEALGEPAIFATGNRTESTSCLMEPSVNAALEDAFSDAEALLLERFAHGTLAGLAADFRRRHAEALEQKGRKCRMFS